jgi:hypothetical protein
MKRNKITLILGWLIFLCSNLYSQNTEGLFKLKEGDWFEVQVEQNNGSTYLLNYQLQKQLPNRNQLYKVRLEHLKVIRKYVKKCFGYDSYYPTFEENKTNPELKNQFNLEVAPSGDIVSFTASKTNKSSEINLTEIGSGYRAMSTTTYNESNSDSLMIHTFSRYLMLPASASNKILFTTESRIPLIINQPDIQICLTDASFPLITNAIILGRVKEQGNQEVKITMIGENSDYNFPEKRFRTQSDGAFNCPIFLKRPLHLRIQIGNQTLTTFMEPGDNLNISAIGNQIFEVGNNQYLETKPNGYYSSDLKKSDYFSGNAACNTMLSNELDQYRSNFSHEKNVQNLVENEKTTALSVKLLIDSYQGKASDKCIEYFRSDFNYFLAVAKLSFDELQTTLILQSYPTQNGVKLPKIEYPTDFFLEVDTMPILMNPFEWNSSYQNFIKRAQQFKQNRLSWASGKRNLEPFLENYYFSQVSLRGYPLYSQIAKSMDLEFRKGQAEMDIVIPYYQDFINNCSDPNLTEPLKKVYETAKQLKIGNQFPINSFAIQDNSIFNLQTLKGKPICLIIINNPVWSFKDYIKEISKFSSNEVEFVIADFHNKSYVKKMIDSTLQKMPNVKHLILYNDSLKSKLLVGQARIFMLDKWFRIMENNAEDPATHKYKGSISKFEKSLRKTIETKRYSKAEKSVLIKTAGWSFGSILFTFLLGLWIYRIRIRRIRIQEAAKRRIKELEIKAIRSQMNPHFIFNALNSIQSLINDNQFKEANIYLSKFAVLLRGVLNNSEKSRISLSEELQAVELYCQLEQLRFEFKFEIRIDPEVNGDLIEIPGMIIQPLAENAVVHGLSAKGNQGKLDIQVKLQNGNLCVCVSDNGIGLQTQKIDELSQKGFGLKLVEERINIINLDGKEARLTVENRQNTEGTIATLIIPID